MRLLLTTLAALLLSGCNTITTLGNVNEGAADFRIVSLADATSPSIDLGKISRFTPQTDAALAGRQFFEKKDNIQITLKTARLNWFSEGAEQRILNDIASAFSTSKVKGEIAIIANVSEKARTPGGRNDKGELEGRVVFYSEDVYLHQRLNEFNIPVYGPAEYGGGPLNIDLWVMELDKAESDQLGAVLQTLSQLATDNPVGTLPGFDILSQIGTAFLKSNEDDVIGHIALTLVPPQRGLALSDAILEVSDIIITRKSDRGSDFPFDRCTYESREGDLNCTSMPDEANFFIVGVRKVKTNVDIASAMTLKQLTDRLSAATTYPELERTVAVLSDAAAGPNAFHAAVGALDRAIDPANTQAAREFDGRQLIQSMQCALIVARTDPDDKAAVSVVEKACGARAMTRQMTLEAFNKLGRDALRDSCLDAADLATTSLVPANFDQAALLARQDALIARLKPRGGGCP